MLSKRYRFHSRGGVRYTYQHGKNIRRANMTLVHVKNSRGRERYAVVVSKKVAKSAVYRNRIRRRVYEAIRLVKKDQKLAAAKDNIFVIYAKDVATMPFSDLKALISGLLEESIRVDDSSKKPL